ncbi:unnamed protein product [Brassica oleracea]
MFHSGLTRHEPRSLLSVLLSSIPQHHEVNQELTVSRSQHNQTDKDERSQSSSSLEEVNLRKVNK